jgi:hypothetical protein
LVQADLVLGELCGINENRTINPAVDHCCKANFAFRRPCFEALKADKMYVPPPVSQDSSTFHADWCQAQNEELQKKKIRCEHFLPFPFLHPEGTPCIMRRVTGFVLTILILLPSHLPPLNICCRYL